MAPSKNRPKGSKKRRSAGSVFADLIGLTDEAFYEPIKDQGVIETGGVLPYKKLVHVEDGRIAGREATRQELEDILALGSIGRGETVIIPRTWVDEFDFGYWDDADCAWTIPVSDLETALSSIGLKRQEAGTFARAQLVQAFGHRRPRAISTLDAEHVGWAGIALQFAKKIADNPEHFSHFVHIDVLQHLSSCQPTYYLSGNHLMLFVVFDEPVSIKCLKALEDAMKCLVELHHTTLRTSYVRDGMIGSVPTPTKGSIVDLTTGKSLPDEMWASIRGCSPSSLMNLGVAELPTPVWRGPTAEDVDRIAEAFHITADTHWGRRNPFQPEKLRGKTPIIAPGKVYTNEGKRVIGQSLNQQGILRFLQEGQQVFWTTHDRSTARTLAVDLDVKPAHGDDERVIVDRVWLDAHVDRDGVLAWESRGIFPVFRFSGRGLYVEVHLDAEVPKGLLRRLAHAVHELFHHAGLKLHERNRLGMVLTDGSDLIVDVDSTINLIRLPGCRHHITGRISMYEDGRFYPSRISSAVAVVAFASGLPTLAETRSMYSTPLSPPLLPQEGNVSQAEGCSDEEVWTLEEKKVGSVPDRLRQANHLRLNRGNRERVKAYLVSWVLQELRKRHPRGPRRSREPYEAVVEHLIRQVCRTGDPFPLQHRRIKATLYSIKADDDFPEEAHSAGSGKPITMAIRGLEELEIIRKVEGHIPPEWLEAGGVRVRTRGRCARYQANMPLLYDLALRAIDEDG